MKIIVVSNQKGGVSKTTTTHSLGAGLGIKGYKVLLIDLDPQANLTDNAGIDRETFCLEEIKDFLTLSPKSLRINVPVFELSNAELSAVGTVLKSAQENRETFRAIYSTIAEKIMKICHD